MLFLLVASLLVVIACEPPVRTSGFRVVSLSPAMTEIIFALQAQDHLVGVTTFCNYPGEALRITKVGDFSNPSVERIVGLKPDLVIVNTPEQRRIRQQLEQLNINVYESSPVSLTDIFKEISDVGTLLDRKHEAESLIIYMKTNIQPVSDITKRVYIELAPRPLVTIGGANFLNDLLELSGGENIFKESEKDYPVVTQEAVIRLDPEIIIILHPEPFGDRIGWDDIDAVINNRVFTGLDQNILMRPGPRLVHGYRVLKEILK